MGKLTRFLSFVIAVFVGAMLLSCATIAAGRAGSARVSKVLVFPHQRPTTTWILPEQQKIEDQEVILDFEEPSSRLEIEGPFLAEEPQLWKQAQDESKAPGIRTTFWKRIFRDSDLPKERFWAAYFLFQNYKKAGLSGQALGWLDEALALFNLPLLKLEKSWLLVFELSKSEEAKPVFASIETEIWKEPQDQSRANFLRKKLFYSSMDLGTWGLDQHISTLALDHDDLWCGTWGGGLGRLSLLSGDFQVFLKPGLTISPVRLVRVSQWFVYVFRDQTLQRYSKVTGNWRNFSYPENWNGLRVQDVVLTGEESFTVAHLGRGLWRWERGTWTDASSEVPTVFLNALQVLSNGDWLIGTQDQGLFRQTTTGTFPVGGDDAPENISFLACQRGPSERVAVGTFGEGLWVLEKQKLRRISGAEDFATAGAWSKDRLWWGTYDAGVRSGLELPFQSLTLNTGVPVLDVSALLVWNNLVIWGTLESGLGFWESHED